MLLITAAALSALGIGLFAAGAAFDRPELAMFGAIVVIGVGGSAVVSGVQVQDGQVMDDEVYSIALNDVSLATESQVRDINGIESAPTSIAFNDTGSIMYVAGTGEDAVHQFSTSDWGLGIATYQSSFAAEDADPTGAAVDKDGEWLFVSGDETDTIYQYGMSEPHNVSTAGLVRTLNVSAETASPRSVELEENGSLMTLVDGANAEVELYSLSDPYNVSSAAHQEQVDVSTQAGDPTGTAFGKNGTRLLVSDDSDEAIYQYSLATDFDISTASYVGNELDTSGSVQSLAGVEYEDAGRIIVVPDAQGGELVQYDASRNDTREVTQKTYRDVQTIGAFPLDVVILLLGAVMLMSGAGQASEAGRDEAPWRRD